MRQPTQHRWLATVLLIATAIVYVFNGFEFPENYIEFRAPDGSTDRMSLDPKDLRSNESLAVIGEIGVSLSIDKRTCDKKAKSAKQVSRQIEMELELRSLIDGLKMHDRPRKLNQAQKKILEKVPICEPYLDELKVISRLLNGYNIR